MLAVRFGGTRTDGGCQVLGCPSAAKATFARPKERGRPDGTRYMRIHDAACSRLHDPLRSDGQAYPHGGGTKGRTLCRGHHMACRTVHGSMTSASARTCAVPVACVPLCHNQDQNSLPDGWAFTDRRRLDTAVPVRSRAHVVSSRCFASFGLRMAEVPEIRVRRQIS